MKYGEKCLGAWYARWRWCREQIRGSAGFSFLSRVPSFFAGCFEACLEKCFGKQRAQWRRRQARIHAEEARALFEAVAALRQREGIPIESVIASYDDIERRYGEDDAPAVRDWVERARQEKNAILRAQVQTAATHSRRLENPLSADLPMSPAPLPMPSRMKAGPRVLWVLMGCAALLALLCLADFSFSDILGFFILSMPLLFLFACLWGISHGYRIATILALLVPVFFVLITISGFGIAWIAIPCALMLFAECFERWRAQWRRRQARIHVEEARALFEAAAALRQREGIPIASVIASYDDIERRYGEDEAPDVRDWVERARREKNEILRAQGQTAAAHS